jgi:hypothetical protein
VGLCALALQVRVELAANQRTFAALGFEEVARTAHPGYGRATRVTMRRGCEAGAATNVLVAITK